MKFLISLICATTLVISGCQGDSEPAAETGAQTSNGGAQTPSEQTTPTLPSGIDRNQMDPRVRPQDDLYRYANGRWLDTFQLPPDKSMYGTFTRLAEENEKRIRQIVEELASQETTDQPDDRKIGDLYNAFMNVERIESAGPAPALALANGVQSLEDKQQMSALWAQLLSMGIPIPLTLSVEQDAKDATRYAAYLYQSGLTMPDRDYYLGTSSDTGHHLADFQTYITQLLDSADVEDAAQRAAHVMDIEKRLAQIHWTRQDSRNPEKTYNPMTLEDLQKLAPELPWSTLLKAMQLEKEKHLIIAQPSYLQGLAKLWQTIPLAAWKDYLLFHTLDAYAPYLSQDVAQVHFRFHGVILQGLKEPPPRWKRAVGLINRYLGEAVGKHYVEKYFTPKAKARMQELVENLRAAFEQDIQSLDWMSEETKKAALEKLHTFRPKIGYPDRWKDYTGLRIDPDSLVNSIRQAETFEYQRMIGKLGKPVDREEWEMTPQTVNAYYNPSKNEIVFPAAILQPPFFNMDADDAANYGAIGAVIGHEMTHGFDDSGRLFDAKGNMRDWWTEEDARRFRERADRLADFFSGFTVLDNQHVNGRLTLGENIADLGGLKIAYLAYQLSLGGKQPPRIDDWTGPQRFFLSWAQVWARKFRAEELFRRLKTDPHAPAEFRVNGPVQHLDAFHEAFNAREGDKLWRPVDQRIRIW
jgi:predicted metalloendopeptidase